MNRGAANQQRQRAVVVRRQLVIACASRPIQPPAVDGEGVPVNDAGVPISESTHTSGPDQPQANGGRVPWVTFEDSADQENVSSAGGAAAGPASASVPPPYSATSYLSSTPPPPAYSEIQPPAAALV